MYICANVIVVMYGSRACALASGFCVARVREYHTRDMPHRTSAPFVTCEFVCTSTTGTMFQMTCNGRAQEIFTVSTPAAPVARLALRPQHFGG